ncbi:hypothetical protein MP228_009823 [Amoeboaphelidium protococcarum]|nr:hypothetical protein MP228_009823 [Amoeboaphelidium protococcarum]
MVANQMTVPEIKVHPEGPALSRLIYGTWRLLDNPSVHPSDPKSVLERIKQCLSLGITSFDLADIYGGGNHQCEVAFGKALALEPSLRSQMKLITKCDIRFPNPSHPDVHVKHYDTSKEYILQQVEDSLRAVQTDYFDILLIHRPDPLTNADEVAEAFRDLQASGKVKYFGVSNFKTSQIELLESRLPFPLVTNQIECSVAHTAPFYDGTLDYSQMKRSSPMIWSPLYGGKLFNEQSEDPQIQRLREAMSKIGKNHNNASIDQVAYAWLLNHPSNMCLILGTNDQKRIETAAKSVNIKLTRQEWFAILEASNGKRVP